MPPEIRRLSKRYLKDLEVTIRTQKDVAQVAEALQRILDACGGEGVIIFACTKAITLTVAETLEVSGNQVAVLNGDVPQSQRERTVNARAAAPSTSWLPPMLWPGAGCGTHRLGDQLRHAFDSEA